MATSSIAHSKPARADSGRLKHSLKGSTMRRAVLSFCLFATACGGVSPSAPTGSSGALGQVGLTDAMLGSELPFRGTLEAQEVHTGAFPVLHSVLTGTG